MTVGSRMAARIVRVPPQLGQCSISISNTRLSNWAQPMRAAAEGRSVSPCPGLSLALAGALGMICGTELGIGCEHAMEANEMQPRTGHQRGEALHEFQGFHHDMGGAVVGRVLLSVNTTWPFAIALKSFIGKGRAGDVVT